MKNLLLLVLCLPYFMTCQSSSEKPQNFSIDVSFSEAIGNKSLDGRLLLMLSNNDGQEPRFQINDGLDTQIIFGQNVEGMKPGEKIKFGPEIFGYPYASMNEIPVGEYQVQALLHVYEIFNLSTGQTVKLPMDNGEGQQWNQSPGNLYSKPFKIKITKDGVRDVDVVMTEKIPPIEEPEDTEWIKHIRIKSEKLSEFWGRDMYLGAHILLPKGFKEHPEAKYPLMVFHGHFPSDFGGFRTTPPDPDLKPEYSERFGVEGYNIYSAKRGL